MGERAALGPSSGSDEGGVVRMKKARDPFVAAAALLLLAVPVEVEAAESPDASEILAEREESAKSTDVERGGSLLQRKRFELEPSLSYAHITTDSIFIDGFAILPVLVVGEVGVQRNRADLLIAALTGRIGLTEDIQLELRVPYRLEHDRFSRPTATPPFEDTVLDGDLGDISASLYWQVVREAVGTPNVILGLLGKSATGKDVFEVSVDPVNSVPTEAATGSGFYALKGSVTFSKTTDPALVFANIGYTHNFTRDGVRIASTGEVADFEPGDTFEFGFGLAYALSPTLSINTQYQQALTLSTQRDGVDVVNTALNVAALRMGAIWAFGKERRIDVSVGIGLTEDSPDTVVEIRMPFSF